MENQVSAILDLIKIVTAIIIFKMFHNLCFTTSWSAAQSDFMFIDKVFTYIFKFICNEHKLSAGTHKALFKHLNINALASTKQKLFSIISSFINLIEINFFFIPILSFPMLTVIVKILNGKMKVYYLQKK